MRTTVIFAALFSLPACHVSPDRASAHADASPRAASASPVATAAATMAPPAPPVLPADVAALAERIEACEHFSGEDPYDAERAAFLREQVEASCPGNDATLANLAGKYAKDATVAAKLGALKNENQ